MRQTGVRALATIPKEEVQKTIQEWGLSLIPLFRACWVFQVQDDFLQLRSIH